MNIPERMIISALKKDEGGELVARSFDVPFEYNFNATNAYRKAKNIEYSEFVQMFAGLARGDFAANEAVGELLWYSIREGCRICFEEMPDLTVEDLGRFLNSDPAEFTKVLQLMRANMQPAESEKKKDTKATKLKNP